MSKDNMTAAKELLRRVRPWLAPGIPDIANPDTEAQPAATVGRLRSDIDAFLSESPVGRTPETVLRAMLKAYADALPDAYLVFARAAPSSARQMAAKQWQDFLERATALLGFWAGNTILTGRPPSIFSNLLRADYEARLSGARPLDAPPLEL